MKYKPPRMAAIFLAYFLQAGGGGGHGPLSSPGSATDNHYLHSHRSTTIFCTYSICTANLLPLTPDEMSSKHKMVVCA